MTDTTDNPAADAAHAVPPGLTDDAFLGGRLRILQPEKGFRAGIDSVFLAAAVPAEGKEEAFEAGIGTGVAALCLLARVPEARVTGLEVTVRYAMIAEQNAARNGMAERMTVIRGDLKDALRRDLATYPEHGSFAHVFANPPYLDPNRTVSSPSPLKTVAHAASPDDLDLWIKVLHAMVEARGTMTMVHRAEMLGRILAGMEGKFGDIAVAPLYARNGMAASRVIVQGVKGSKAPLRLLPGLVLHAEGSKFTPEADAVLRHGQAWKLR